MRHKWPPVGSLRWPSTSIEEISASGPELDESQLAGISGGMKSEDIGRSSKVIIVASGSTSRDHDF
ncbi:putative ATP-grasp target RiPP [Rhodococcus erythropolis]|uniref:Putative ATP-grasp target RiPP n=2 Tax=Rhodococcus erythropolis TaxID=1833 RepID=A0A8I1D409_RHOER|nr:putative ATP-grasp target RiPP [Rhodococcus erythropolis]